MKNLSAALVIFNLVLTACAPAVMTATQTITPTLTLAPSRTKTDPPTPTTSATATRTSTLTPTSTITPTPTPTASKTATATSTPTSAPITVTLSARVSASSDDANQDGGAVGLNLGTLFVGTASAAGSSYTGLRFSRLAIPPDAKILSAWLQVYSTAEQWIGVSVTIAADATSNSPTFSAGSPPSQRALTTHKVMYSSDAEWKADTWYIMAELAPVIQEVVSRRDWRSGNSLSLILTGIGASWGRKAVMGFDGSPGLAPTLLIKFRTYGGAQATATMTLTPP